MRAPLLIGLALCGLLATRPALAERRASRPAVEAALKAHDRAPSSAELAALGAGTDAVLVQIGGDAQAELPLRAKAVSALAYLPTPAARRFLNSLVRGPDKSPPERQLLRKAAVALGWLGGTDVPGRLSPLLESDDPEVRLDAVVALGLTRLPSAAELLRQRLPKEREERVKGQIARQLHVVELANAPVPLSPPPPPAKP